MNTNVALVVWMCATATAVQAQTLPHNIPDFSTDTTRPTVRSVASGDWSSASTWSPAQVPTANHIVHVDPGHVVTIGDTTPVAYTIAVHGKLRFNPSVNTRLKVTNLMVMGDHGMASMTDVGHLEIGTAAGPIASNVTAEIVISNTPIGNSVADPEQFGTGLLNMGRMTIHGAVKTPTFVRLAVEPRAAQTTLTLSEPVSGWQVGDRLVIPDTRHIKESEVTGGGWVNAQNQWEELTIQSIAPDNRSVTLTAALRFDHLGARDQNGVLDFLPHAGNLSRNVVIRSESATGTRGHTLSVHRAESDVRYARFLDLGRTMYTPLNTTTNAIGRYPVHQHHNFGPTTTPANGYQFTLIGNAVDGGSVETKFKWGIAVHNSHYGLIQDNVVYNYNGGSIVTEDGSESFNVFDHNFAMRGMGEPNNAVSEARMALGTEGVGFWFRGPNNYVRNNVAANYQNPTTEAAYGFVYQFRYLGNINVPNFKGADTKAAGQFTTKNGNNLPILQFDNNEAYGAMQGGFTYWWVSSQDPQPSANAQESVIRNLKLWHIYNKTVYHYPSQKVTFDGLVIRGNFTSLSRCCGDGFWFEDYSAKDIVIRNADIQGVEQGIKGPSSGFGPGPNLTVENSYLRNWWNIGVPTPSSVNGCWMENKLVVIKNTRLDAPPGRTLNGISMAGPANGTECLTKLDEVRVYAHNGNANDNFQVYHTRTNVLPRPPSSCTPNSTRPGIPFPTCPIPPLGSVAPTVTLSASPQTIAPGAASTLSWSSMNATSVTIDQGIGAVAASGTRSVSPTATTTYTITATNSSATATATATVTVVPRPTATLSASPTNIGSGQSSTLSWTTTDATSVTIDQGIGSVAASGSRSVSPTVTTTYTLTASNAGSSVTATATVTVATTASFAGDFNGDTVMDSFQYNSATGAWSMTITGQGQVASGTWWTGWQVYILDLDGTGVDGVFFGNGSGRIMPIQTGIPGEPQVRPWLSPDRLRMYFASTRGSGTSRSDLFVATRPDTSSPFGPPTMMGGLSTTASWISPSLTSDELVIVMASDNPGGKGGFDLWMATRASRTAAFSAPTLITNPNSSFQELNPEISADGLTLYFESDRTSGEGGSDVWVSIRASRSKAFRVPVNFGALNTTWNESHPALNGTTDLFFVSNRPGGAATANTWRMLISCASVTPTSVSMTRSGGSRLITISDSAGCGWVAATTANWITVSPPSSGSGSGTITINVSANPGTTTRSGTVRVGGRTVSVSQTP